jgi:hypothetical protein
VPLDPAGSPQKIDFTSRYRRREDSSASDELAEYFRLTNVPEGWGVDPLQWWYSRRPSSLICAGWYAMFFAFLVHKFPSHNSNILVLTSIFPYPQGQLSTWNIYFQVGATQLDCAVQV